MTENTPIEKLTTAVFAFALAVGALSLTTTNPKTPADIAEGLFYFSLSFIILVVIWWSISAIMARLDQTKPRTIFLNIVLLFFVAIEPYLLNILSSTTLFPLTTALYGADMAILMGLCAALCHIVLIENHTTLTPKLKRHITNSRNNQFICMSLFLISLVPQFYTWRFAGMPLRVLIWFATLAFTIAISARNRTK